jgi:hypothetical protein
MFTLFKTKLGRIRIIGFLEGLSLLVLIFVAIPMKHLFHNPALSKFLVDSWGNLSGICTQYDEFGD